VKKSRKHYTGEEKVAILRRHLLEEKTKARMRNFIMTARTMIEGDGERRLNRAHPRFRVQRPEGLFYLTRHLVRLNQVDSTLELLERVVAGGFCCYPAMLSDPWLEPVRKRPEFVRLLARAERQYKVAESEFARLEGDRIP
jgi:hypothetical protein